MLGTISSVDRFLEIDTAIKIKINAAVSLELMPSQSSLWHDAPISTTS